MSHNYNRDETVWGSADGTNHLIKDLSTSHLVNILNWMHKHNEGSKDYNEELVTFMESEAKYRVLFAFAANEAIPRKLESGWWEVTNQSHWNRAKSLYYKYKTEAKIWHRKKKGVGKLLFFKRLKDKIRRRKEQLIRLKDRHFG